MSDWPKKKLPDGVAVIFFENVGSFDCFNESINFKVHSSAGLFAVGYSCGVIREASKKAQKRYGVHELLACSLRFDMSNKKQRRFIVFGTWENVRRIRENLQATFTDGTPLTITMITEEADRLPIWWNEK